jgi:pilus assembly protein Flp/PilA
MLSLLRNIRNFLNSEDGPTAIEYALILSAILAVCLVAIQSVGTAARNSFNNSATQLSSSVGS